MSVRRSILAAVQMEYGCDNSVRCQGEKARFEMGGRDQTDWKLVHDDGELFRLFNLSGSEATDVEVRASELQLDGMGHDFVHRERSVPDGGYVVIGLKRVWGTNTPKVQIEWTGNGACQSATIA